jgi:hypothetical protein
MMKIEVGDFYMKKLFLLIVMFAMGSVYESFAMLNYEDRLVYLNDERKRIDEISKKSPLYKHCFSANADIEKLNKDENMAYHNELDHLITRFNAIKDEELYKEQRAIFRQEVENLIKNRMVFTRSFTNTQSFEKLQSARNNYTKQELRNDKKNLRVFEQYDQEGKQLVEHAKNAYSVAWLVNLLDQLFNFERLFNFGSGNSRLQQFEEKFEPDLQKVVGSFDELSSAVANERQLLQNKEEQFKIVQNQFEYFKQKRRQQTTGE